MKKCAICGGPVQEIKDRPYRYDECGLPIMIYGIPQYHCLECGEDFVSIPNQAQLHKLIGRDICRNRKALLKGAEIRFLRKSMRLKAIDLAAAMGVDPSTVSRWENDRQEIGEAHDRLLRLFYLDSLHIHEPAMDATCGAIDLFKSIPRKRRTIEEPREIILNPQEWLINQPECCPA